MLLRNSYYKGQATRAHLSGILQELDTGNDQYKEQFITLVSPILQ